MKKAITAATIAEAAEAALRPCLNDQSIIWPEWVEPGEIRVQQTAKARRWAKDDVIEILNRDDA